MHYPHSCDTPRTRSRFAHRPLKYRHLWRQLNPLIALALELKRRGHTPVMALPAVYQPKIAPLGLEFHPIRPDIDPTNTILVEMIYDVNKGTERGLREFLFPVLRQTYDDLLDAATKPVRADLMLLGELNYAGPIVAEVTGIPWASYVLAPFSFFSAFDPPVLPPYPRLARADKIVPGMGRGMRRLARFVTRKWPEPIYAAAAPRTRDCRPGSNPIFDAKHSPFLVLALFSRVLGQEQKDWPTNTLITGFCFYDADAGNTALPEHLEELSSPPVSLPIVFTLGSSRGTCLPARFTRSPARAAMRLGGRAVLLIGSDARKLGQSKSLPDTICLAEYAPYSALSQPRFSRRPPRRSRHHRSVPPRRQAHAHHALLPRPARQRPPHEPSRCISNHAAL